MEKEENVHLLQSGHFGDCGDLGETHVHYWGGYRWAASET